MSLTNLYLTRHLQRIDDTGSNDIALELKWNTIDSKILNFNPYLSDKAYTDENINKLINNLSIEVALNIDIIITSPFLRCLQTSLIIYKKINELKSHNKKPKLTKIQVNFCLSEFIDNFIFFDVEEPINIENIYNQSINYLQSNNIDIEVFNIIPNDSTLINFESEQDYSKRIISCLNSIYNDNIGKNILIITHACSSKVLGNPKELEYTQVIQVEKSKILSVDNDLTTIKKKYLKYKKKYLQFKNKIL